MQAIASLRSRKKTAQIRILLARRTNKINNVSSQCGAPLIGKMDLSKSISRMGLFPYSIKQEAACRRHNDHPFLSSGFFMFRPFFSSSSSRAVERDHHYTSESHNKCNDDADCSPDHLNYRPANSSCSSSPQSAHVVVPFCEDSCELERRKSSEEEKQRNKPRRNDSKPEDRQSRAGKEESQPLLSSDGLDREICAAKNDDLSVNYAEKTCSETPRLLDTPSLDSSASVADEQLANKKSDIGSKGHSEKLIGDEKPSTTEKKRTFRHLWSILGPEKFRLKLALAALMVSTSTSLAIPRLLGLLVDRFGGASSAITAEGTPPLKQTSFQFLPENLRAKIGKESSAELALELISNQSALVVLAVVIGALASGLRLFLVRVEGQQYS